MIQLDTRNGHNQVTIEEFNKVSGQMADTDILQHILTRWADDRELEGITATLYGSTFNDIDGNILSVDDLVVLIDDTELVENPPKRGYVLQITALLDLESNFVECGRYSLFAHRLLKVKKSF